MIITLAIIIIYVGIAMLITHSVANIYGTSLPAITDNMLRLVRNYLFGIIDYIKGVITKARNSIKWFMFKKKHAL